MGRGAVILQNEQKNAKSLVPKSLKSMIQRNFLGTACSHNFTLFLLCTLQTVAFYLKKKEKKKWLEQCGYICYIWVGCFSKEEILRRTLSANRGWNDASLYVGSHPISLKPQCRNCCLVEPKGPGIPRGHLLSFTSSPAHPAPSAGLASASL